MTDAKQAEKNDLGAAFEIQDVDEKIKLDTGDEISITFRPYIRADASMAIAEAGVVGALTGDTLFKALPCLILRWSLPFPVSEQTLRRLGVEVFSKITEAIIGWEDRQIKNSSAASG